MAAGRCLPMRTSWSGRPSFVVPTRSTATRSLPRSTAPRKARSSPSPVQRAPSLVSNPVRGGWGAASAGAMAKGAASAASTAATTALRRRTAGPRRRAPEGGRPGCATGPSHGCGLSMRSARVMRGVISGCLPGCDRSAR
ncbi:hypothetical protein SMICM304S_11325 [Streptomyces microflavus]